MRVRNRIERNSPSNLDCSNHIIPLVAGFQLLPTRPSLLNGSSTTQRGSSIFLRERQLFIVALSTGFAARVPLPRTSRRALRPQPHWLAPIATSLALRSFDQARISSSLGLPSIYPCLPFAAQSSSVEKTTAQHAAATASQGGFTLPQCRPML